jgi:ABC-type multidrug transport system fused ATPase/permease subunit
VTDLPPLVTRRARLPMLIGEKRSVVLLLALCSAIAGITEAALLVLIAEIAALAARGAVTPKLGFIHIHASGHTLFLLAFGLTLARLVLQVPLAVLPSRISADVQAGLRRELLEVFTRASWDIQSRDREGYLQETMSGQVTQAAAGAIQATQLVISAFTFVALMATAISLNAIAAAAILVGALVLFGALRPFNILAQRFSRELSEAQLQYAGGISEAGRMAEETQVFGTHAALRAQADKLVGRVQALWFRSQLVNRLAPGLYQSAVILILVAGMYVIFKEGRSHFTALTGVVLIVYRAGNYGQQVQSFYQGVRTALPFIDRLQDTARRYAASIAPDGQESLDSVRQMSFEEVAFSYREGEPVLKQMSFAVNAGEAVGVVGPSGAGKSTMIQILLQLREPLEGAYLVNGLPARDYRRSDWYARVAYVPQQPRLLHATVAENIRFWRADISDEDVRRAAQLARIDDDVMSWPSGYDTVVGPRVDAVSGGQQQRICLARALAARPAVLVLDEPTSALDPQSERLIQASLEALRHEMTLFIIAHRMSTLDICDRVMVIVDGRVEAFDTIDVLARNNPYYRSASVLAAGAPSGQLPT